MQIWEASSYSKQRKHWNCKIRGCIIYLILFQMLSIYEKSSKCKGCQWDYKIGFVILCFEKEALCLNQRFWTLVKKMNLTFQNKPCSIYNNYKNQATYVFWKKNTHLSLSVHYCGHHIDTCLLFKNRVTHENEKYFKQHNHILVCTIMQTLLF